MGHCMGRGGELLNKAAGGVNSCFERAGRVIRVLKAGW